MTSWYKYDLEELITDGQTKTVLRNLTKMVSGYKREKKKRRLNTQYLKEQGQAKFLTEKYVKKLIV